jgi:hypothetical protein
MDMPALLNIFKPDMLVNLCSLYPCCTSVSSHAYSTNVTAAHFRSTASVFCLWGNLFGGHREYFVSGKVC